MDKHTEEWERLIGEVDACETVEGLRSLTAKADIVSKQHPPTFDDFLRYRMVLRLVSGYERLIRG